MADVKILLVEDESLEALDIKLTLESFGYEVPYVASSGEEVVEKALEIMPDLILMDIVLKGDTDGIDVASKIKNLNIPVIYLTAHSEESKIERAKLTEPDGYIIKPYDRTELKYAIELAIYKKQMEKELKESEDKYCCIVENVLDAYLRGNTAGQITMASPSAALMYRFDSPEEMMGISALSLYKSKEDRQKMLKELTKHGKVENMEGEGLRNDGTSFWVSVNAQYYYDKQGIIQGTDAFVRDITANKIAEERIDKLYRLYATLSQIDQAIVRIKSNNELFQVICEICVEYGKFQMAWIGLINPKTGNIKPVTYSGHEDGYLKKISMNIKESPSLHKPTIMAIDEGEFSVSEDIDKDLNREWCEEALKRNYRSLVSLPLKLYGEVIGILNIYSSQSNFFTEEEIDLVKEIGLDISFALDLIKTEQERELAQKALLESEEKFRTVANYNYDWEYWISPDGDLLYVSPSCERITGYLPDEFIKEPTLLEKIIHPHNIEIREHIQNESKGQQRHDVIEYRIITKQGEQKWIAHGCQPVYNNEGEFLGRRVSNREITKRKKAESKLIESQEFLENIVENIPNMIFVKNADNLKFKMVNKAGEELLGHSREELLGKNDFNFFPKEEADFFLQKDRKVLQNKKLLDIPEETIENKNLGQRILHTKKIPIFNKEGNPQYLLGISEDITELKQGEIEIKKSLDEKETLLREIHHRVKNNLQIIASLLNLQESTENDAVGVVLKESMGRVKTMATIHEKLYQSPTFNDINFKQFTEKLVNDILYTYGISTGTIKTKLNIENININIDTAMPLGLIINELVTNTIKYAFPKSEGTITIQLKSLSKQMELTIADNGIGLPKEIDIKNTKTLGLKLVKNLVDQLDGKIGLERNHGTTFKITFKELKYKERI